MTDDTDFSLESVIILILGVFAFLFGLLLLGIHAGHLSYNPDSTYGLFLVIVAFQVITMGRTPFGDLRRSWALILVGICAAIIGMAACFIPGYFTEFARELAGMVLLTSGICLLLQMFLPERKARMWILVGGILRKLAFACALVYTMTATFGIITLFPGVTTELLTATLLIIYGVGFFYLSWCIRKVAVLYPKESGMPNSTEPKKRSGFFQESSLPLSILIIILLGILLTFLGLLLIPVNLGLLPFSPDGQFGILLTIMAIQMMSLGDTPLGQYQRSSLIMVMGLVCAALGIFSCISPGVLTGMIRVLLGFLNVIGGAALLIGRYFPLLRNMRNPSATPVVVAPIVRKLTVTQTTLNCVTMVFGVSMLVPGLVPGLFIAGILVVNGLLLFILALVLQKITEMLSWRVRQRA